MRWIAAPEKDTATVTLEKRLWDAADQFRANSGLKPQEYSSPILGLIFLRFAELRFAGQRAKLEQAGASSRRGSRVDEPAAYHAEGILYLAPEARFAYLLTLPEAADIGARVDPVAFRTAFTAWVRAALPSLADEPVGVDGKAVRGSRDGANPAVRQVMAPLQPARPPPALEFVRRQPVTDGVAYEWGQFRQGGRDVQPLAMQRQWPHYRHRWVPRVRVLSLTSLYPRPGQPGKEPTALFGRCSTGHTTPRSTGYARLQRLAPDGVDSSPLNRNIKR